MPEESALTMRFVNQRAAVECGVTDMPRCVDVIENTFGLHARGRTLMGGSGGLTHGQLLRWPEESPDPQMPAAGPDRRFSAMPAYVGGDVYKVGVKWYGSNVRNPSERGLPRSMHLITLNDPDTGRPVAVIDGTLVSAMRTGAVAGVGARHIRGAATSACVIGAGVIGRTSTMALDAALDDLEEVTLFDIDEEKATGLAGELSETLAADVTASAAKKAALEGADVVVVAAAGATPPTLRLDSLDSGVLVVPLGDVDLPADAFERVAWYVDDRTNVRESLEHMGWSLTDSLGEAVEQDHLDTAAATPLGELVVGDVSPDGRELALLTAFGLPMEDVAWATDVYERAVNTDAGKELTLFESPHWV
jgi:ornithine cyclodeaminase